MKWNLLIRPIVGVIIGLCLILVMAISAVEIAAYSDYGFYETEYKKYNVNNPNGIVDVKMDELIRVTEEMMSYLRGNREDMVIFATVDGVEKEMFNDVEKYHMADVREIFIKALEIRRLSVIIIALGVVALGVTYGFKNIAESIFKYINRVIYGVWAFAAVVAIAAMIDFTQVFYVFHYIFFDNMGWLLDPDTSRLINMLPEGFFVDIAIRIGVIYILLNLIILALAFFIKRGSILCAGKKSRKNGGTYEQG